MLYSNTGFRYRSITGGGLFWHSILCDWLIPNRNTDQHIGIAVLSRSICVACTKGLECGSNGSIILGGIVCGEALVFCTGLLGLVLVCGRLVPSSV